ncbi:MAG: Asp23/Gls24 family envelope stress response protein [Lachnospiraceae bacterium]|nr:Asp23/Gls24 family envelope stress response protein [Lachnospiraceae bacterium]MBQ6545852.1 Asp23/Gls24 family envelope stress response protein [Lachnospiraceae bacterium]
MEGRMNTEFGEITVDSDVISIYAGSVAVECFGIVGMAAVSMKDGLVKLLRRENTDDLKHGISVKIEDNSIYLSFHVIVAYGVNILTIYDNLADTVKYKVEQFTGMTVSGIHMYVEGVRVID